MVNFIYDLLVATLLGLLAGMGVGGGSLLLLWLTQIAGVPQAQARLVNLLFFLPAAVIATLFRKKQTVAMTRITVPAILCGCIAAAVFSYFSSGWNVEFLRKLLGGLLILTGLHELFYRPRKAR